VKSLLLSAFLSIALATAAVSDMTIIPAHGAGSHETGIPAQNRVEPGTGLRIADETDSVTRADHLRTGNNGTGTEYPGIAVMCADPRLKNELLSFAKKTFLARLGFGKGIAPPDFALHFQRACFVTFFSGRKVIACFGGFYPRKRNMAAEIEDTVKLALLIDPRARLIDRETALAADVQITFPEEPHTIATYAEVDPVREGLLVENETHGVAIVPGEAKTASWAFREAVKRLGEKDPSHLRISKFQAHAISTRKVKWMFEVQDSRF
jgi:AMMECR1 domain-containing protein